MSSFLVSANTELTNTNLFLRCLSYPYKDTTNNSVQQVPLGFGSDDECLSNVPRGMEMTLTEITEKFTVLYCLLCFKLNKKRK